MDLTNPDNWSRHENYSRVRDVINTHGILRNDLLALKTLADLENYDTLKTAFETFKAALEKHHYLEDHKIFPHLFYYYPDRCKGPNGFKGNDEEHASLAGAYDKVTKSFESKDTIKKTLDEFIETIENHLLNEEKRVIPVVLELSTYE